MLPVICKSNFIFLLVFGAHSASFAQDFDKKEFCSALETIVSTFSASPDSLATEMVGENSLGIQEWRVKHNLPMSINSVLHRSFDMTSEENRAIYLIAENISQVDADNSYKEIVQAIRSCYGTRYLLRENVTTEWDDSGKKLQHRKAVFLKNEIEGDSNLPEINVTTFAVQSGNFSVTVELLIFLN